ncbi:hypothetical protein MSG28_011756 [Choristoneura fumiferana]|uniref:Uncharacterized protein n=1 Tax=Choristoneura fumiferana TaxID=7141 RepID=A0ACC0KLQ2_CHOFU|nr:hypothetical protein MSG28_011756 [Choristoneura fumiferana]
MGRGRKLLFDVMVFSVSFYVSYTLMSYSIERFRSKSLLLEDLEKEDKCLMGVAVVCGRSKVVRTRHPRDQRWASPATEPAIARCRYVERDVSALLRLKLGEKHAHTHYYAPIHMSDFKKFVIAFCHLHRRMQPSLLSSD